MNLAKLTISHRVIYGDDFEINLKLRTGISKEEYQKFFGLLREASARPEDGESRDRNAECLCFLVKGWDLEDDEGPIPVVQKEVSKRVDFFLVAFIADQAFDKLTNGGLTKKI
jgi:hypothetical protein